MNGYEIYYLRVRETGQIFYVGCSFYGSNKRLVQHKGDAKNDIGNGIKNMIIRRNECEAVILETWAYRKKALEREKFFIDKFRSEGYFLCNKVRIDYKTPAYALVKNCSFGYMVGYQAMEYLKTKI